ncbi:MAG: TIGR03905 family TSCPD domain-containing protein [Negativicutes bacterium]|jgi:uncharacterized protein (TIGR03905 family)
MATYIPDGVCPSAIHYDVVDGKVRNLSFEGGCKGNLSAIGVLLEGMPVEEVIAKLRGNQCRNGTSCADQLSRALENERSNQ